MAAEPAAARGHIDEVEAIARQALADVRATTSGYREVRVATEIASARSVLLAAGIEAEVPAAVEPLAPEVNELFGYAVREAVTNVVRHSGASSCGIRLGGNELTVTDDGRGIGDEARGAGSGLRGLAERVAAAGGTLSLAVRSGGGTVVRVVAPAAAAPNSPGAGPIRGSRPAPAEVLGR